MKTIIYNIVAYAVVALAVTSCLKDEETVTSPECSITSFTVGDIKSGIKTTAKDGSDSTYYKTLDGDDIYFNIDQIKNRIDGVDSLPSWTDLSRVVPTITSDGYIYVREKGDSLFSYFNSGSDSIDFTSPVEFMVVAYDGLSTKTYTARMYKSTNNVDSLVWTNVASNNLKLNGYHKSLVYDERIYVFAKTDSGMTVTSSSLNSNGRTWTTPVVASGDGAALDYSSVLKYGDKLYALDADGSLYTSDSQSLGKEWKKATDKTFERLLAADNTYIYAYDGSEIVSSADLNTWTGCGDADLDYLPTSSLSFASYTSKTNGSMNALSLVGLSDNSDNAVVWYKVSSPNSMSNQDWSYMKQDDGNEYVCPKLENLSIVRYDNRLFAIGGKSLTDDSSVAYSGVYASDDNGLSWRLQTEDIGLPAALSGQNVPVSITTDGTYVWLIQSGGSIWRGIISGASND